MVQAGDGEPRSEKRKAEHIIAFRLTDEQVTLLKENAKRWGYENPNFFTRDISLHPNDIPIRMAAQLRVRIAKLHAALGTVLRSTTDLDEGTTLKLKTILEGMEVAFRTVSGDGPK